MKWSNKKAIKISLYLISPLVISIIMVLIIGNYISANEKNIIAKQNDFEESKKVEYQCTDSEQENIQKIATDNHLKYYDGDVVTNEVSKSFSNPLIPNDYRISENDIETGYALSDQQEKPLVLVLTFKSEEKFNKMDEFLGFGEIFVGYSKRSDYEEQRIIVAQNNQQLRDFNRVYKGQMCY